MFESVSPRSKFNDNRNFFYWEVFKHHFCTHKLLYAALLKTENSVTIEQYFLSNMFWHIQSKYKAAT